MIKVSEKKAEDGRFGLFPGGALLLSPFAKILSGILLAGLLTSGGFALWKMFEVKNLTIELMEEKENSAHLQSEFNNCKLEIEDQNNEIARIVSDLKKEVDDMQKLNDVLNERNVTQRREIENLRDRPAPLGCEESEAWLRDNLDIFGDN